MLSIDRTRGDQLPGPTPLEFPCPSMRTAPFPAHLLDIGCHRSPHPLTHAFLRMSERERESPSPRVVRRTRRLGSDPVMGPRDHARHDTHPKLEISTVIPCREGGPYISSQRLLDKPLYFYRNCTILVLVV